MQAKRTRHAEQRRDRRRVPAFRRIEGGFVQGGQVGRIRRPGRLDPAGHPGRRTAGGSA